MEAYSTSGRRCCRKGAVIGLLQHAGPPMSSCPGGERREGGGERVRDRNEQRETETGQGERLHPPAEGNSGTRNNVQVVPPHLIVG